MTRLRLAAAMALRIEPHADPDLLVSLVDGERWTRAPGELERRFRLPIMRHLAAHDPARDAARDDARDDSGGPALGNASVALHQDAGECALAWVSGMIVRPEARGRGVGRALVREALALAAREGAARVGLDATPPARALYESEGFVALAETPRWRRAPDAPRVAPASSASSAIYPISSCEIMELHAYDAPRFGAGRGAYLADLLAAFPARSFVAFDRRSGVATGFAVGQERYVGPLVADSPDIAARLLYACERAGTPPLAHLLDANPHARRVFEEAGYAPDGASCTRMLRAPRGTPPRLPGRPDTVYAIGAWAMG
jgi:GNAT superfamily N-acetyltransferase